MTGVILYIFGVWNLGKTNIFRVWDFEDGEKYLGSKIDGKLTYLVSEILRAKINYLGSWIRSQSDTLKEQIIMQFWDGLIFWDGDNFVSENLVNMFGVFEKFGQHIWGSGKWPDMITPVIKINEFPSP